MAGISPGPWSFDSDLETLCDANSVYLGELVGELTDEETDTQNTILTSHAPELLVALMITVSKVPTSALNGVPWRHLSLAVDVYRKVIGDLSEESQEEINRIFSRMTNGELAPLAQESPAEPDPTDEQTNRRDRTRPMRAPLVLRDA